MNFLTAKWQHLLFANYKIQPTVLEPFLPRGTKLDSFKGSFFISLVAFMFNRTRILGLPIPYHINFEEVNLRFYVCPQVDLSKRGVTFIKEIVPRSVIPFVANNLFNENYIALRMSHTNSGAYHKYTFGDTNQNLFSGEVANELKPPEEGSIDEFITEHYWGYSKGKNGTLEYKVQHPIWKCCQLKDFQIEIDYASIYGNEFSFLTKQKPYNVLYAEGSAVSVSFPKRV